MWLSETTKSLVGSKLNQPPPGTNTETQAWVQQGCRTAGIGCLDCKKPVIESVLKQLEGFRQRAREYEENPELVRGIVAEGCERAREAARATMAEVREAVRLEYR